MKTDKWLLVATVALLVIFSFIGGRKSVRRAEIVQRDTVVVSVHDTITKERPVPLYTKVVDTMFVPVHSHDTIRIRDSVFLALPKERKVYGDSTYYAVVSGYKPSLDTLKVYRTTKYITVTNTVKEPPRHWKLQVTAGPSVLVTPTGDVKAGLGATLGFGYAF